MNPSNIDWEQEFGETWKEMDDDARWMAVLSTINRLSSAYEGLEKTTSCISNHKLYFKLIGLGFVLIVAPIFVWWVTYLIGG